MASLKKSKKHLDFTALRKAFSSHLRQLDDTRQPGKCQYSLHDIAMSAFACLYFQDPSLLAFQQRLQKGRHRNNLQTLFGVENIPSDTQIRHVLDHLDNDALMAPIFKLCHERLRRHHHLDSYAIFPGLLMCSIDGTQYHSSKAVHCRHCLSKQHGKGSITYSHSVLQGAIMHPDHKPVLPVMPEVIRNIDGDKKQDCESNAAKRFVRRLRKTHPRQGFLLNGDGLMSHQPLIEEVLAQGMHYLFVAKPSDHRYWQDWLEAYSDLPELVCLDHRGREHRYRWQNGVPLHGGKDAITVNWFEYTLTNKEGKTGYRNSWVTDLPVTKETIEQLVKAGRCRWKIENECFNTLKNQGYHLEHNYGHGKANLCDNLYLLTLLAFTFHQIFELTDGMYQACHKKAGAKYRFWEEMWSVMNRFLMDSWFDFLDLYLNGDDWEVRVVKNH